MKLPYLVATLPYSHKSAGIRALYNLVNRLNENGYEAYAIVKEKCKICPCLNETKKEDMIKMRKLVIHNAIAVYPEAITNGEMFSNNSFWSKHPVGWRLSDKNKFGFTLDGLVFTWAKAYDNSIPENMILRFTDYEKFFCDYTGKRKHVTFYVGKARGKELVAMPKEIEKEKLIHITGIWPKKRKQVAKLLQRSKYFVSYDGISGLVTEARLCGCPVFIMNNSWKEEHQGGQMPVSPKGLCWDIKEIEKARSELKEFKEEFDREKEYENGTVISFIKVTQKWAQDRMI